MKLLLDVILLPASSAVRATADMTFPAAAAALLHRGGHHGHAGSQTDKAELGPLAKFPRTYYEQCTTATAATAAPSSHSVAAAPSLVLISRVFFLRAG